MVKALVVLAPGGEEFEIVGAVVNMRRVGVCELNLNFLIPEKNKNFIGRSHFGWLKWN